MLFGSVAWACTQRVGTLLVCRPPASTYVSSGQCGKISGTSTQTGGPTVFRAGGTRFSVKATNFYSKKYNVTFRNVGSTSNCHRAATGVTVLSSATPTIAGSAASGKVDFLGPSFQAEFLSPAQTTTGQAKVCVQDMPDVVTGQVINLTVI